MNTSKLVIFKLSAGLLAMVGLILAMVASALAEVEPPTIWCCYNGNVEHTTPTACAQRGGKAFSSESAAMKDCKKEKTWCCHKTPKGWQVDYVPTYECNKLGGICYPTKGYALDHCGKKK
jgi:hypothetical protein